MTGIVTIKIIKTTLKLAIFVVPLLYYKSVSVKRDKALEEFYKAFEREEYDRGLWLINQYVEENPKDFGGYLQKGYVLTELERTDEAIDAYIMSINRKASVFESQKMLADCYLEEGKYRKAIVHYGEALKVDKKRISARFNRGVTYMHLEEYAQAIKDFKSVLKKENGDKNYIYEELTCAYLCVKDLENYEKYTSLMSSK